MEHISNDILLFQRIRQDDRLALNELFTAYYQKLCRFAITFNVSTEQAEEVVSDVFFTLWKKRDRLEVHSNVKAYLYKCVRNAILSVSRKHEAVTEELEDELIDPVYPQLMLEYEQLQQHVEQIVNALPARCRQIFIMNRFEGLKYREISKILGLSEKTVEHQIVKALDIVRKSVRQYQATTDAPKLFIVA